MLEEWLARLEIWNSSGVEQLEQCNSSLGIESKIHFHCEEQHSIVRSVPVAFFLVQLKADGLS